MACLHICPLVKREGRPRVKRVESGRQARHAAELWRYVDEKNGQHVIASPNGMPRRNYSIVATSCEITRQGDTE